MGELWHTTRAQFIKTPESRARFIQKHKRLPYDIGIQLHRLVKYATDKHWKTASNKKLRSSF